MYIWPCFLNYLRLATALKEAERAQYVPEHDSCETIVQVSFFHSASFNTLLVCPLISPLL